MAALNMASRNLSSKLDLQADDMILYSAKVIPGNDKRVRKMLNRISHLGSAIHNDPADGLHTRCALAHLLWWILSSKVLDHKRSTCCVALFEHLTLYALLVV